MIDLWDYHTHNARCNHAEGNLQEYIKSAITKNLSEIGVSDHWPMGLMPNKELVETWAMPLEKIPEYIEEAYRLKLKYKDQIQVRIATEVDFCSSIFQEYRLQLIPYLDQFDYLIGSVHVIQSPNGPFIPIDGPNNPQLMKEIGVSTFYQIYFDELYKLVKTGYFQIVGHFDLPKKYGISTPNELELKIDSILSLIKKLGMVVEINTSGLRKEVKEQYPSQNIIERILQKEIAITLGSDAHKPKEVGYKFQEMMGRLKIWCKKLDVPLYLAKFNQMQKSIIKIPFNE